METADDLTEISPYRPEADDIPYSPSREVGFWERLRYQHPGLLKLAFYGTVGTIVALVGAAVLFWLLGALAWFLSELVPKIVWLYVPYLGLILMTYWTQRAEHDPRPVCPKCRYYGIEGADRCFNCPQCDRYLGRKALKDPQHEGSLHL